jgi:hypothetical protein
VVDPGGTTRRTRFGAGVSGGFAAIRALDLTVAVPPAAPGALLYVRS